MRRMTALILVVLMTLPLGGVSSAAADGTISGVVRLAGSPKSGVTVAFIELQSGAVVRATSREDGTFVTPAPVGEYTVTTESQAGLTVKQAPVRVVVVEGKTANADLELAAVPSAMMDTFPAPNAPPPGAATPVATAPPATAPPATEPAAAQPPAATPGFPAPLAFAETTGSGAQIQFKPVTCFLAGEFPLLNASIEPAASVARARVYFKANRGDFFYYIEMSEEAGRYAGKLPRPYVEASPITYYLQSTTTDFEESQTREIQAAVVKDKQECGDREMAAIGPPGPVTVFSAASGAIGSPTGFATAAASGILVGIVVAIAGSAAAAGIVGGVVVNPGGGPTPPSPIVNPTAIPTPQPIPAPTPTPVTTFR
jgi:hypothetical protein